MDNTRHGLQTVPSTGAMSRRVAARGLVCGGLMAALLAATGRSRVLAQATPSPGAGGPVGYALKGDGVEIDFRPATTAGAARLDYRDTNGSQTFTGDRLIIEDGEALGRIVSALVDFVSDGYDRYLTLLVPSVNPIEDQNDVPIQTMAIKTTHRTSIGGPSLVKGALQTYEVVALEGVAIFGAS